MPLVGEAKRKYMRRRYRENPKPQIEYSKKYDKKRRKINPEAYRNIQLKRRYGLTNDDYKAKFASQNGLCALCKVKVPTDVDHNHITNEVRGLLCRACNIGLGMFGDTKEGLKQAIQYLENYE